MMALINFIDHRAPDKFCFMSSHAKLQRFRQVHRVAVVQPVL